MGDMADYHNNVHGNGMNNDEDCGLTGESVDNDEFREVMRLAEKIKQRDDCLVNCYDLIDRLMPGVPYLAIDFRFLNETLMEISRLAKESGRKLKGYD